METWDFLILGTLEVRRDGVPVPVPAAKHRIVLASLLLRLNHVVSADELYARLWGTTLPPGAKKTLQGYVARLRKLLGPDLIRTRPNGYVVLADPQTLDLDRFERLLARAEQASATPAEVAVLLRRALAVWRGEPLADVPSDLLQRTEATRLAERRLAALEWRVAVDLALGRHAALVPELSELVSVLPHREPLWGHLMTALHQSGRQADALDAYRRARALLVDELGIEPGRELQELHREILSGQVPVPAAAEPPRVVPAELPPDTADFTGRREAGRELRARLLTGPAEPYGPGPLVAAVGPAGVGKTALALHVAHRARDRFPAGQLYADLRGADPADVLRHFLRALGVADAAVPGPVEERSALYRSLVAGKPVLVVLDDAAGAAQLRPLLPGCAPAATLITARVPPTGLPGLRTVRVGRFDRAEATGLLAGIVGTDRVAAEPAAADALLDACGGLPLAVRIAGARLVNRPHVRLAWLAGRLADDRRRLDELVAGDLDLRRALSDAAAGLPAEARRAWQALGRVGRDLVDATAFAARLGVSEADSRELLDLLAEHQLVEVDGYDPRGRPRYVAPELTRLHARENGPAELLWGPVPRSGQPRPA